MIKRMSLGLLLAVVVCVSSLAGAAGLREVSSQLVGENASSSVVRGADGWLFLKNELAHITAGQFWGEAATDASRTRNKKYADPLPVIIEYNQMLAEKNISLYLMPVPPKALVYPDKLGTEVDEESVDKEIALYSEFYEKLAESGVKTIDVLPTLLENSKKSQLYCKTDTHYSGTGLALFSQVAADVLKKEEWYDEVPKVEYEQKSQKITINGDLSQMAGNAKESEELDLVVISRKNDKKLLESDPESPVILLGDSHALVFSAGGDLHAKGAGLFDHLSSQLGFPVDLLGVRGSGVTPARIKLYQRSKKDGDYLKNKKVVIWCFTARDFTGTGGWKKIPVAP